MTILFVCTANICRSIVAEATARHLLSGRNGFSVESAGIDVVPGMKPDKITVALCRERGYDVAAHSALQLTKEMLLHADVVLCMEEEQKRRIVGAYPVVGRKVFLLTEYESGETSVSSSIEDPIGKSKKQYVRCFQEIEQEVRRIAATWLADSART